MQNSDTQPWHIIHTDSKGFIKFVKVFIPTDIADRQYVIDVIVYNDKVAYKKKYT